VNSQSLLWKYPRFFAGFGVYIRQHFVNLINCFSQKDFRLKVQMPRRVGIFSRSGLGPGLLKNIGNLENLFRSHHVSV
jgi:hypothetical protein